MREVSILGVPMDLGQDRRGVDVGPSAIRYARLTGVLEELGYAVTDHGNVETPIPEMVATDEKPRRLGAVVEVCRRAASAGREMVRGGAFPIFLGGDHSVSLGTVTAVASAGRTGVIWLDAHADFNTHATSPSGNVHGMPLAALAGYGHPGLVDLEEDGSGRSIRPEDTVIIGLRSVDPAEKELLSGAGVSVYTMKEVDAYGAASIVRRALADLDHLDRVHLSFDLDAVDPEVAPGVGTPVRGGLTYREAHLVMELINESSVVTSLDMVEVNPILDTRNGTAELAVELAASLMGRRILDLPG